MNICLKSRTDLFLCGFIAMTNIVFLFISDIYKFICTWVFIYSLKGKKKKAENTNIFIVVIILVVVCVLDVHALKLFEIDNTVEI